MAIEAYPVGSNSGFSEESAIDSERDRLIAALGGRMSDFIVDPFTGGDFGITTSTSSYDVDIAAGDAFLGGHIVQNDAAITLTVDASTTNEIFLVVDDAANWGAEVTYTSDGTTPSGMYVMKIWEATTDGSGVTGTTDFRKYTPFEDGATTEDSVTGRKSGTTGTIDISTTGLKTVDVTFNNPYRVELDQVIIQVNSLTATDVGFDYWRAINRSTSGFTVEISVGNGSSSSGETADFDWFTQGK
jgi:hypothetical protein